MIFLMHVADEFMWWCMPDHWFSFFLALRTSPIVLIVRFFLSDLDGEYVGGKDPFSIRILYPFFSTI